MGIEAVESTGKLVVTLVTLSEQNCIRSTVQDDTFDLDLSLKQYTAKRYSEAEQSVLTVPGIRCHRKRHLHSTFSCDQPHCESHCDTDILPSA